MTAPATSVAAIQVQGLEKSYKGLEVLRGVLAWCVGILIVAYCFAMVTYRRRIS
jgi:hypothetical protein